MAVNNCWRKQMTSTHFTYAVKCQRMVTVHIDFSKVQNTDKKTVLIGCKSHGQKDGQRLHVAGRLR